MKALHSQRASALIIVLAFIVLISIVMLSYMASTQSALKKSTSSAAIVETDLLADTAIATVIDDLRQEMVAGSSNAPTTQAPYMIVTNAWAMVPSQVLNSTISSTDTNFANLVKQSIGTGFYPGNNPPTAYVAKDGVGATGRARASGVSTAQPSLNGRLISPARWNEPRLLTGAGFTATNQLPNWILITRSGPAVTGAAPSGYKEKNSSDYVIGRFAYNIYDVGGLLDINIAGYPQNTASESALKGSLAWADLTAIPGVANTSAMQRLVDWRNKLTQGSSTNYISLVRDWAQPRGFKVPYSQGADVENRFFGRQDLIKFATSSFGSNTLSTNALPYLTTFSADVDQPSFSPHPRRPKVQRSSSAGGNDAFGLDDQINPSFLQALNSSGGLQVSRRFPLDRLKYVLPRTPSASQQGELIQQYFGLSWDEASYSWIYSTEGNGSQIKRLSQISGRSPNFVELLKAAISVGSLGGQYRLDDESGSPRDLGARDGSINRHIMQIVASIIDQYDADSYPTRITFDGGVVFGVEDVPYIYSIRALGYRLSEVTEAEITASPKTPQGGATKSGRTTPYRYAVMMQPAVWNPHKPSAGVFDGPTDFRITANGRDIYAACQRGLGESNLTWWGVSGTWYRNFPSTRSEDTSNAPVSFNPNTDFMSFRSRAVSQPDIDLFREPFTLKSPNFPPGSQASGGAFRTTIDSMEQNDPTNPAEQINQAIGFHVGYVWGGPADSSDAGFFSRARTYGQVDFALQYRTPEGRYVVYDELPCVPPIETIYIDSRLDPQNRRPRLWARVDPRADRFGPRSFLVRFTPNSDQYFRQGETYRPGPVNPLGDNGGVGRVGFGDSGTSGNVGWIRGARPEAWNTISDNKPTSWVRYTDPDGVLRRAMGGYNTSGTVGLPLVYRNEDSRPVILNRPFRSVAELGYAFRGMPWKQLDFWTPESGDAALLDVFCISEHQDQNGNPLAEDQDPIVGGRFSLNTKRPEVVQALLQGVAKADGVFLSEADARSIANALVAWTSGTASPQGPLKNRAELVGRYDDSASTKFSGFSSEIERLLPAADAPIQMRRQSVMRALADTGTTRTWAFLIDIIVQKGKYPANSTGLDKFMVEGEQRYWVHLALDRITGKVLFEKIEMVHE